MAKDIFSHTVHAPFMAIKPNKRIKVLGRKPEDVPYKALEKDFGPLTAKSPDPLKDEPIKPLEIIRKAKPKPLTEEEKKKILNSYSPPPTETPSYLTLKISGKKQMQSDKNLVR